MADSPPRIRRDYGSVAPNGLEDDMTDGMMLFPNDTDSGAFMSPGLRVRSQEYNERRSSPVDFPVGEDSQTDGSPSRITVAASKISAAETKTTAQMTNLTGKSSVHPRSTDAWDFEIELMTKAKVFTSVLLQPLPVWNDMEEAVLQYAPQWKPSQRSKLIELWIKFIELKVIVEDYSTDEDDLLLEPTQLIGRVWYSIAENPNLYQEVTFWIQDFHHKERRLIYRPPLTLIRANDLQEDASHGSYDATSTSAQFQNEHHHKLERAQRLFICYFQQPMPESLQAVSNMSKRRSVNEQVLENNIVPENASDNDDSASDFEDDGEEEPSDEHTYDDDHLEVDSRGGHSVFSGTSEHNWLSRFQNWVSCWEDPFGGNISPVDERKQKTKSSRDRRKHASQELRQQTNDASFWAWTTDYTTRGRDDDEKEIRRSTNIEKASESDLNVSVPDLNETDEGSSTLWVTFDKQDDGHEDDEITFLTMDTALVQGSPDKRSRKAQFYSPPRRTRAAAVSAATSPQSPKTLKAPSVRSSAKNPPPSYVNKSPPSNARKLTTKATPPRKSSADAKKKNKEDKEKEKKDGWGRMLPDDWSAIKTKFRIASMIIKELE